MRIVHVIIGLNTGGAETMLYKLLAHTDRTRFSPRVVAFMDGGPLRPAVEALGVPVSSAGMRQGVPTPGGLVRLLGQIRAAQPDLIQGWMYHGNLAAQLAASTLPSRPRVLWGVRTTAPEGVRQNRMTRGLIRLGAWLSPRPEAILYNSRTSARQHEALGYDATKTLVIPNGFELTRFGPDAAAYAAIREELGLSPEARLVGLFGRYHPVKDQANFLKAASLLAPRSPDWYYVLAGRDVDMHNAALQSQIAATGLEGRVRLLGERPDMPRLFAAMDVVASASKLEAFSNVIGEAMASAVPCVVTDVGDSAWIVGETGRVVPPENAEALAAALGELMAMDADARHALGRAARERVAEHFAIEAIAAQYERLYERKLPRP